jgi:hypothetical protein
MSADWAFLDSFWRGASWTVVSWWALVATLGFSEDWVLLGGLLLADVTLLTRSAPIDVQISARLAILRRHTSCSGTGGFLRANGGCVARERNASSSRAVEAFGAFLRFDSTYAFTEPSWWANLGVLSSACWADVARRARVVEGITGTLVTRITFRAEIAVFDVVSFSVGTEEDLLKRYRLCRINFVTNVRTSNAGDGSDVDTRRAVLAFRAAIHIFESDQVSNSRIFAMVASLARLTVDQMAHSFKRLICALRARRWSE